MISFPALRPGHTDPRPRSGPLETSSPRRHHGAGHQAVPTPERTMSPVRHKNIALVGKAAIRELRNVRFRPRPQSRREYFGASPNAR